MIKNRQLEGAAPATEEGLSIKELGNRSGVPIRTIRYYQTEGLLPPPALNGKFAVYSSTHLDALNEIKEAKATRGLAQLYDATRASSTGRPSPAAHAQRGDRVEKLLRCVVGEGVEVLIATERAGLSPNAMQTMLSEIAALVQGRVHGEANMTPSLEPATPEGTKRILDELVESGLTDEQFRRLHPKPGETIKRHLSYVGARDAFHAGSVNALVNHRLQLCRRYLRERDLTSSAEAAQPSLLDSCVDDAARAIPIP